MKRIMMKKIMMKKIIVKKSDKSQISVEMVMIFSALLIIFVVMAVVIEQRNSDLIRGRSSFYAKTLCEQVASEINSIFLGGAGTQKTIHLPDSLKDGSAFLVSIYPEQHLLEVLWFYGAKDSNQSEINRHLCSIVSGDLTGNLTNIAADFNISNSGQSGNNSVVPAIYAGCNNYCTNLGYTYGICRHHGQTDCYDHGETPGQGNIHAECKIEGAANCCCG